MFPVPLVVYITRIDKTNKKTVFFTKWEKSEKINGIEKWQNEMNERCQKNK